jgi:hypothetical protein
VAGVEGPFACANDTEYGLSAAVFRRDVGRAWQVADRLQTGIWHINGPTLHDEEQMPLGGVKGSGWGRFNGMAGVREFTELGLDHHPDLASAAAFPDAILRRAAASDFVEQNGSITTGRAVFKSAAQRPPLRIAFRDTRTDRT